jgi:hypothetical protein
LLAAICLCGCSSTRVVNVTAAPGELKELNDAAAGKQSRIVLADGTTLMGSDLSMGPRETSWLQMGDESDRSTVATRELRTIRVARDSRAALQGGLLGALGGAVLGVTLDTYSVTAPTVSDGSGESSEDWMGTAVGAAVGALIGAMVGWLIGCEDVFVLRH